MEGISYDEAAAAFIGEAAGRDAIRILAIRPNTGQPSEYARKLARRDASTTCPSRTPCCSWRCGPRMPRTSRTSWRLRRERRRPSRPALLEPGDPQRHRRACCSISGERTGGIPHAYFGWTEGNPITYLLKYPRVRRRRHGAGLP